MAAHHAHALGEAWFGQKLATRRRGARYSVQAAFRAWTHGERETVRRSGDTRSQVMERPLENPRIIKRAPADTHARATGLVDHLFRCLRRRHVAVANDGNGF